MDYESEPLPFYNNLRNRSHSIMLNYTDSPSTYHINVPGPDPTISPSELSPASSTPLYRVHKWEGMSAVPQWLPAISECTPSVSLRKMLSVTILKEVFGIMPQKTETHLV